MAYLFSPPTWRQVQLMKGSLRYGVTVATTAYRAAGTWYNIQAPAMGAPDMSTIDIDATTGIQLYFDRPTQIPDSLATAPNGPSVAVTPSNPSWTPGSLVHL